MPQSFTCPSCGAPLDYRGETNSVQCPYCFTASTVPPELRSQPAATVEPNVMLSFMAQATKLRELANLVQTGQKPAAVSLYQQIYKVDAATAVRAVNSLTGIGNVIVVDDSSSPPPSFTPPPINPLASVSMPPTYTYSPPASSATYTVTQSTQPAQRSNAGCIFVVAGVVLVAVIGCAIAAVAMFAGTDNIGGIVNSPVDATAQLASTQVAMAATEHSQAQTQIARTPSATMTLTPTASATATIDPGPELTVTALLAAQATADAQLVAEAQVWPVIYQENFDGAARGWDKFTEDNNDYYQGSRGVIDGVYRWDLTTKQDVVSFVWPDPYSPVGDFYASVDFTITGVSDAAAGFTFYHSSDDQDLAYYVIDSDGNYLTNFIFGQSNVSSSGSTAPLAPGVNRLGLVAVDQHLVMLLNGQQISNFDSIFNIPTQGDVGIVIYFPQADEAAVIEFDNFEIRTPN